MAIKRFPLTKELLDHARTDRDAGKESQFAIESPRGLNVRIRGGEVAYYVQARTRVRGTKSIVVKRRLGTVGSFSFEKIKTLATELIYAIKHGRDPDAVIEARAKGGDEKSVAIAVDRADAVKEDLWTWDRLITEYTQRKKRVLRTRMVTRFSNCGLRPSSKSKRA